MIRSEADNIIKRIVPKLIDLGWDGDGFHYEVSYSGGQCDMLYTDRGKNVAILEAKKPGAGRKKAFDDAKKAAKAQNVPIAIGLDGVSFLDTFNLKRDEPLFNKEGQKISHKDFHLLRKSNLQRFIRDPHFLEQKVKTQEELISIFNNLNRYGKDLGLTSGVERLEVFAKIIFLKMLVDNDQYLDLDEWEHVLQSPNNKLVERLKSLIKSKSISSFMIGDINIDSSKPDSIRKVLEVLDSVSFSHRNYDAHSTLFQVFLSERARGGRTNDLGQYFTPDNVIDLLFHLADYKKRQTVYDPYCGTGGILCKFFSKSVNKKQATDKDKKEFGKKYLFGSEISATISNLARMNMVLAGDGHTNIESRDSLIASNRYVAKNEKFDRVVTNMPFAPAVPDGMKEGYFVYSGNSKISKFIEHCLNRCARGGRVVIIVPKGFITGQDEAEFRKNLLNKFDLRAVYNLYSGIFDPYTASFSAILVIDKRKPSDEGLIDFFTVEDHQDLDTAGKYHNDPERYKNGYYKIPRKAILEHKGCDLREIIYRRVQVKKGYCRIRDLVSYVAESKTKISSVREKKGLRKMTTPNAIEDGIGLIDSKSNKRVEDGKQDSFNYELQKNAIVISRITNKRISQPGRYIGSALVGNDAGNLITGEYYQVIPYNLKDIYFILFYIRTKAFQQGVAEWSKGTGGQQRVEIDLILDSPIALPTDEDRHYAVESLSRIEDGIATIEECREKIENVSGVIYGGFAGK